MPYTNTTQITGPGSGGANPFGTISNAMAPIYSMFGSPSSAGGGGGGLTGGGSGPFGLQPQPVSGADNDLTAYQRSMMDLMGTSSANLLNMGTGVTGAGLGTEAGALQMLQQPYGILSALASGNPSAMTSVAAPLATTLATQANVAGGMADASTPMGGARAVGAAGRPQMLASTIGQSELGYQQQALQQLMALAGLVGNIGGNITGTGTTLTGQGLQGEQNTVADILQKMGINITGGTANQFSNVVSAIGSLLGGAGRLRPGCWIAEAIYGTDDLRTHLVRAYLNGPFKQTTLGRFVMALYLRFGRAVAAQVRKRDWLRHAFRPLFDRALRSAVLWIGG